MLPKVWTKTEEELERVVSKLMTGQELEEDCRNYLECVRSMEHLVRPCGKCKRKGCEKCSYNHALRRLVRHQKPGDWWQRTGQRAVMGSVRFLQGK